MSDSTLAAHGLKDAALFRQAAYINGGWASALTGETVAVTNPATGETLGSVPSLSADETEAAVDAAHKALAGWGALTGKERSKILRRWLDLINANADDLCRIITLENGKPLAEARGELDYGTAILEWFAEEAKRIHGEVLPQTRGDQRLLVIKQPIGVVAGITAWNFPLQLVLRKAAPALAAGCTIVVKPADLTPLSALALAELAERAGIPAGVLNIVTGDAATIGKVLTSSPVVRKVTFTGSTPVGRLLMEQSAATVKHMSLELGGNAPFIVFADADLEAAADALTTSRFRNTGQACVCANRAYIHRSVHDRFASMLTERVANLKMGNGLDEGITLGPLIDTRGLAKVERLVSSALEAGAHAEVGGKVSALGGLFFEPTVLSGVSPDLEIVSEEIFGPVITLIPFDSESEVVGYANDSIYGLAAYMFTRDNARIWRVAEAIESGMIGVNTGMLSNEVGPFGGVKQSGLGREGSRHGLEDFLDVKYVCIGQISPIAD